MLRTLTERYQGRPLAGVLLLTDGNATDLPALPDLQGLPPIYPVVIGNTDPIKDISLNDDRDPSRDPFGPILPEPGAAIPAVEVVP